MAHETLTDQQQREGWAFVAPPSPSDWPSERITCGAFHPNPEADRLTREMSPPSQYDGCGRHMVWSYAYRCVDCGRWFHRACIRRHFAASTEAPY